MKENNFWSSKFDAIYCLSLANNLDRRKDMEKELNRVGILKSGIFQWKITVRNRFYNYMFSNKEFPDLLGWSHIRNSAFCTIGHYEIMKAAVAQNQQRILILEDDVRFLKDVSEIKEIVENIPDSYDICMFDKNVPYSKDSLFLSIKNDKINDFYFDFSKVKLQSCACYALSTKGMKRIIDVQERFFLPADYSINIVDENGNATFYDDLIRVSSIKNIAIQDFSYKKYDNEKSYNLDVYVYDGIADLSEYNIKKNKGYVPFSYRYTVMTFIFGGYENLHEIEEKDPDAEYICVTDDKNLRSGSWKIIYDERLEKLSNPFDKCCYVRYHPFEYCSSDICMKVDGSVIIKKSTKDIIDKFEKEEYGMSVMIHPARNTIKDEYVAWINLRGYSVDQANKCLGVFYKYGYPEDYKGLYQVSFVIQKNDEETQRLNLSTYESLKSLGENGNLERIDQIVFSVILNFYFSDKFKIMPVSEWLLTNSEYFSWCNHKSEIPIMNKEKILVPYLFNKECSFVNF